MIFWILDRGVFCGHEESLSVVDQEERHTLSVLSQWVWCSVAAAILRG